MRLLLITLFLGFVCGASAQNYYAVFFCDKGDTSCIDIQHYFSLRALSRRAQQRVNFNSDDYPVCKEYTEAVKKITGNIQMSSKWLNAAVVKADEGMIAQISKSSFIQKIERLESYPATTSSSLCSYHAVQYDEPSLTSY